MTTDTEQLAADIKRVMELDAKRTPGEWLAGVHPANGNINIVRPIFFGNRGGKLPECEGAHLYLKSEPDCSFIASAPLMATIIAQLWDEREQQRTELRSALYPNGIKHPDQAEWQWLIERVKEQREALEFIELLGVEPNDLPDGERISRAKRAASKSLRLITSQPKEQSNDR